MFGDSLASRMKECSLPFLSHHSSACTDRNQQCTQEEAVVDGVPYYLLEYAGYVM